MEYVKYLCSLSNANTEKKEPPRHLFTSEDETIAAFVKREDRIGRGIFSAIGLYAPDETTRNAANTRAVPFVVCDCDLKNMAEGRDAVLACLRDLALPPSWIHDSGHGLRPGWQLAELATSNEDMRRCEVVMRRLAQLLAGDPAPTNRASLYRWPGSHNTKSGDMRPCVILEQIGKPYALAEIEEMLDLYQFPLLHYRPGKAPKTNGKANGHATEFDFEPSGPIDVEARLAAMEYKGAGYHSIHFTQLHVTGALLNRGEPVDEITARVLAETARVADRDTPANEAEAGEQGKLAPSKWDWDKERKDIRQMCFDLINKAMRVNGEDLGHTLPERLYDQWNKILCTGKLPVVSSNGHGEHVRGYTRPEEESKPKEQNAETVSKLPKDAAAKAPFIIRPFEPFDVAELPPREFLFGKHYQRRTVSGTVAPGGTGKSSLVMVEYIAMAAGRDLFGDGSLKERVRTWYHNGEDNMLELKRRLAAICQHYNIPQQELAGWFFMTSGVEVPLRVAESYNQVRLQIDHRLVKCITEHIGDNKIAAAGFDPLVTVHGVREADPGQMDAVVRIFAKIADDGNCSNDLSHHTRKQPPGSNGVDVELDDMRGAKAISDAMRMVRILNPMSARDAEAAGIDDLLRTNYFRIDRGKANYSAPAKTAIWRQFVNVELPNGDGVGVVTPWQFPGADGAPSPQRMEAERKAKYVFLETLRRLFTAGRFVGERGPNSAPAVFAKEREAQIAKVSKAALGHAMRQLFDEGKIHLEEYTSSHRNKTTRIVEA